VLKRPKRLITDPDARELVARIGEGLKLLDTVRSGVKAFVLSKVYGATADVTCSQSRTPSGTNLFACFSLFVSPCAKDEYITYCQLH
jgi:hypothetical protein